MCFLLFFFNFSLEHAFRSFQVSKKDLKLNGTDKLLVLAGDVNLFQIYCKIKCRIMTLLTRRIIQNINIQIT